MFSHPTPQQLVSEAQQYAAVAAQQITARHLQHQKEASSSPERYRSPDISIQNVRDKVKKGCKLLIILRGLPGSGKSTLARYYNFVTLVYLLPNIFKLFGFAIF
jgi:ABC-type polysaccharide/polyol phosphate transport system ATPase subunit